MPQNQLVDINSCKKNLIVEVSPDVAQEAYNRLSREFARHARIPGFRPGKVPLALVQKRFQDQIKKGLIEDLVPRYFQEAVQERQLKPISEPHLDQVDYEVGGSLRFQATFEILPPLQLEGYRDLRVTATRAPVSEEDIHRTLEGVQQRHARFADIGDRASALGDFVTVDLAGKLEDGSGVEFQDKGVILQLGDADTVAGFTENLCGLRAGDRKTFVVEYPADYRVPRLAGQRVTYDADLVALKQRVLPALDDDLAAEAGDFSGLEELRGAVVERLEAAAEREYKVKLQEELLEQVIARNSFDVPECLVDDELRKLVMRIADSMAQQGIDVQRSQIQWKKIADENRPRAENRARKAMALGAIADQENIVLSDAELDQELQELAAQSHKSVDALRAQLARDEKLDDVRQQLRLRKALEWLQAQSAAAG